VDTGQCLRLPAVLLWMPVAEAHLYSARARGGLPDGCLAYMMMSGAVSRTARAAVCRGGEGREREMAI
jgi:hypothetical protein